MLIQDNKYRVCDSCRARHLISERIYGCDTCKKVIDMNQPEREYLSATVFSHTKGNADIHACSWVCMMKALRKVKTDYFVSPPFLHYDKSASKGMRASDFFKLLK